MSAKNSWTPTILSNTVKSAADAFADYDPSKDYTLFHQGGSDAPIKFMVADDMPTSETDGWLDILRGCPVVAAAQEGGTLYFLSPVSAQIGILANKSNDPVETTDESGETAE